MESEPHRQERRACRALAQRREGGEDELWSEAWKAQVAKSKFNAMPAYATAKKGYLALQDHGDPVWFRSLKVKVLPATKGTN